MVSCTTEHLGSGEAGRAAANDDDPLRRYACRLHAWLRFRLRAFLSHENFAVALLDRPARDRAQGRGVQGFACAQVEASVMPRAAHGVADHDAVGERTVIMRAMGADREHLRPATHQENLVIAGMTDELAAIGKLREVNALHQIWTGGFSLLLSHSFHPWRSEIAFAAWPIG